MDRDESERARDFLDLEEGRGPVPILDDGAARKLLQQVKRIPRELAQRYQAAKVWGLEVQPVLQTRAPRHVFVLGEVRTPGRYTLEGPTTAMQAV